MAATSMQNLIKRIASDYPELKLSESVRFQFSPPNHLYYSTEKADHPELLLLHELGHYLINETDYTTDIELLEIEAKAWSKARELCTTYHLEYDEDFAEDRLDSYRDYLHYSSLCKNCQLAGYQDDSGAYHCALCGATWRNKKSPTDLV